MKVTRPTPQSIDVRSTSSQVFGTLVTLIIAVVGLLVIPTSQVSVNCTDVAQPYTPSDLCTIDSEQLASEFTLFRMLLPANWLSARTPFPLWYARDSALVEERTSKGHYSYIVHVLFDTEAYDADRAAWAAGTLPEPSADARAAMASVLPEGPLRVHSFSSADDARKMARALRRYFAHVSTAAQQQALSRTARASLDARLVGQKQRSSIQDDTLAAAAGDDNDDDDELALPLDTLHYTHEVGTLVGGAAVACAIAALLLAALAPFHYALVVDGDRNFMRAQKTSILGRRSIDEMLPVTQLVAADVVRAQRRSGGTNSNRTKTVYSLVAKFRPADVAAAGAPVVELAFPEVADEAEVAAAASGIMSIVRGVRARVRERALREGIDEDAAQDADVDDETRARLLGVAYDPEERESRLRRAVLNECVACKGRGELLTVVAMPCRHLAYCKKCGDGVKPGDACGVCKGVVQSTITVFG